MEEQKEIKQETEIRLENDAMGNIVVPASAYYGSQTQRAAENFKISGIRFPPSLIKAQGIIKASSAAVNAELGLLQPDIAKAIEQAAQEIIDGKWNGHFVVDVYQAGAGTSQNMNANEIIARRAFEILGGNESIHPNDHVNMSQSTNDTFPSAVNMSAAEIMNDKFLPALFKLQSEFQKKAEEFMPFLKAGRTHLHDGVPMRLGEEFSGYAETLKKSYDFLNRRLDDLYEIGLGGKAIGTKLKRHPDYIPKIIDQIKKRTNLPFRTPENMFSFIQNMKAPIRLMLALKELAVHLIKITSDLRLLSSGPRTGISEIILPPVQPGSSIMPGKVNPAVLEMTHMVCLQVIGYETSVSTAGMSGQLEINVFMPLIAHSVLTSLEIMSNAIDTLTNKCIKGIQADETMCKKWMEESISLVTGLSEKIGYDAASQIGLKADLENKTLKKVLEENGMLTEEYLKLIDPNEMI